MSHSLFRRFRTSVALFLLLVMPACSQTPSTDQPTIDPGLTALAGKLSDLLHKAKAKRVLLVELRGPEGEIHPVGKWLTDRLSEALKEAAPDLELLDRAGAKMDEVPDDAALTASLSRTKWLLKIGRSLDADAVVQGSFAKVSQRLGITLSGLAPERSESQRYLSAINGAIPIPQDVSGISPDTIPGFKGGIAKAGVGGMTNPTCLACPLPEYTSEARAARYEGTVSLDVTVSDQGKVMAVTLNRGPGLGLGQRAIAAVKKWRLKPAVDVDGRPVPTRVVIEVSFRMIR